MIFNSGNKPSKRSIETTKRLEALAPYRKTKKEIKDKIIAQFFINESEYKKDYADIYPIYKIQTIDELKKWHKQSNSTMEIEMLIYIHTLLNSKKLKLAFINKVCRQNGLRI